MEAHVSAGSQLLHLQSLDISYGLQHNYRYTPAPDFRPLVSCCPSLQKLSMQYRRYIAALLAPLRGLSGLHALHVGDDKVTGDNVQALCQLTGLRELCVSCLNHIPAGVLLQLTEMQQLTALNHGGWVGCTPHGFRLACKVGGTLLC
jgi:hypothetical protein